MLIYDLCVAWNWEHDADFVLLLQMACHSHGLSLLQVTPANLWEVLNALDNEQIAFRALLDRASDGDTGFMPLVDWARQREAHCINPHEQARRTWDKAAMHLALISAGLQTPYTIVLPPYTEQPIIPPIDLSPLGECFTIKPAHGGGSEGVVTEATSWDEALAARQAHPTDRYLLQAHIIPIHLGAQRAWFRVIHCAGKVYPCWWNIDTHVYTPVSQDEHDRYRLGPLQDIAVALAELCGLHLFSTEISLSSNGLYVVVDYVNDQIDLRLQSKAVDGVPDDIVRDIAGRLAGLVAAKLDRGPGDQGSGKYPDSPGPDSLRPQNPGVNP